MEQGRKHQLEIKDLSSLENEFKENLDFIKNQERFKELFSNINFPLTLHIEEYYSDRDYKDSYYYFFSSKYRDFGKYTHRIAIFEGECKDSLYDEKFNLEEKLIGVITIKPFKTGMIGKTFFNPNKLKLNKVFVRTTNFEIGLLGRRVCIETFPFSSQDGQYMTCAETSLWAILQYYGTRYKEYRVALPHEIIGIADNETYLRVSPSVGLNYAHISKVLKDFGFSPMYYSNPKKEGNEICENFKKLFHYYVESGIPLMVGIEFKDTTTGHLALCIGKKEKEFGKIDYKQNGDFEIANSADFVDEYVIMDDNKIPFSLCNLDNFNYKEKRTVIKYFIVPLYKRIFLNAEAAEKIFYEIIKNETLGLKNLSNNSKFIIKIFLATSRNYKVSRFQSLGKIYRILDKIPLSKFLWICEISTEELYKQNLICGEIVLDATASERDKLESIILLHYSKKFAFRVLGGSLENLKRQLGVSRQIGESFKSFNLNLKEVGNG